MLALLWTLIHFAAVAVWMGIAADSIYFWRRLRASEPALASAYFRELVTDLAVLIVLMVGAVVGVIGSLVPHPDDLVAAAILVGLFTPGTVLLLLGLYRYWRRRSTRRS